MYVRVCLRVYRLERINRTSIKGLGVDGVAIMMRDTHEY
jgi:hypothetical protein